MLDIRTLMLSTGLITFVLGLMLLLTTRGYPAALRRGLALWGYGMLAQPLGWILLSLRGQVPDWASVVLGNAVLVGGFATSIFALEQLSGTRRWRSMVLLLLAANVAVTVYTTYLQPSQALRIIGLSAISAVLFGIAAHAALAARLPSAPRAPSHWFSAIVYLIGMALMALRVLVHSRNLAAAETVFSPLPIEQVSFAFFCFCNAISCVGFMLMCNDRFNAELVRLAAEDPLTGAYNRRTFEHLAADAFACAQRDSMRLAVLLIDGDHSKRINDEHGHAAGDQALRLYVQRFRGALGDDAALGRIGGEEFAALLPDCDEGEALCRAEALRAAIEASDFRPGDRVVPLRVSVGVAALDRRDGNFEALLHRADAALYAAKRAGRNRVMPASALAA
jgi:diguanylate cyclase (GGDEF)-like protein